MEVSLSSELNECGFPAFHQHFGRRHALNRCGVARRSALPFREVMFGVIRASRGDELVVTSHSTILEAARYEVANIIEGNSALPQ